MNCKPILFSGEMVRAILEGRKTQTRRVIKPQPSGIMTWHPVIERWSVNRTGELYKDKYGRPGDRLWVRETFAPFGDAGAVWFKAGIPEYRGGLRVGWLDFPYKLDSTFEPPNDLKWRPSIFMPRWASRITLEVTDIRIERVQDISSDDIKAEGCPPHHTLYGWWEHLWDSINAKRGYSWESNPWVWVVSFRLANEPQPEAA